jgi:fatty acid synthase
MYTLMYISITPGYHGLPKRGGKLKDISKFDAAFFGVHGKQANGMDPQLRLLLEVTYEALIDAGETNILG